MHCLKGHAWSVACYTQLTGHDGAYIIDRVQYLVSSVEPGKNVMHLTPLQVGDVALSYSISGNTAHGSIQSDCEVHIELVSASVVSGYPLSVVFKFKVQNRSPNSCTTHGSFSFGWKSEPTYKVLVHYIHSPFPRHSYCINYM